MIKSQWFKNFAALAFLVMTIPAYAEDFVPVVQCNQGKVILMVHGSDTRAGMLIVQDVAFSPFGSTLPTYLGQVSISGTVETGFVLDHPEYTVTVGPASQGLERKAVLTQKAPRPLPPDEEGDFDPNSHLSVSVDCPLYPNPIPPTGFSAGN